jgi:integrase
LKQAREKNFLVRKAIDEGKALEGKEESFRKVAEEWLERRIKGATSEGYYKKLKRRIEMYVLPYIGEMPLSAINAAKVLEVCRIQEEQGKIDTSYCIKREIGQVFNYGIATDRTENNPTSALQGALKRTVIKHRAAITEPEKIGMLMRQIEEYPNMIVREAMKFSALTFCRPGEIRGAEWEEIEWEKEQWKIPAERMKMKTIHIVPLAKQTIALLERLQPVTGYQKYLFPSPIKNGRTISENTICVALRAIGYKYEEMTAHGFRGMASTILYENGFNYDHIERQLAHARRNAVVAAYNHAEYLPQRREMMQWYADWLDEQKQK